MTSYPPTMYIRGDSSTRDQLAPWGLYLGMQSYIQGLASLGWDLWQTFPMERMCRINPPLIGTTIYIYIYYIIIKTSSQKEWMVFIRELLPLLIVSLYMWDSLYMHMILS